MKTFIKNWNFKKHIVAESMFYTSVAIIGNAFFKKPEKKDDVRDCPIVTCKNMPKKQKIFNCSLLSCFAVDLVAGYCLLKGLKKIVR